MQTLCTNNRKTAVGISQNEDSIWLCLSEELICAIDDIATGSTKVVTYCIHIDFGIGKLEVAEEDAVEVVVVVLAGVGKDHIEILAAGVDDCCKTDDLRTGSNNDDKLKFAVILEVYV